MEIARNNGLRRARMNLLLSTIMTTWIKEEPDSALYFCGLLAKKEFFTRFDNYRDISRKRIENQIETQLDSTTAKHYHMIIRRKHGVRSS